MVATLSSIINKGIQATTKKKPAKKTKKKGLLPKKSKAKVKACRKVMRYKNKYTLVRATGDKIPFASFIMKPAAKHHVVAAQIKSGFWAGQKPIKAYDVKAFNRWYTRVSTAPEFQSFAVWNGKFQNVGEFYAKSINLTGTQDAAMPGLDKGVKRGINVEMLAWAKKNKIVE